MGREMEESYLGAGISVSDTAGGGLESKGQIPISFCKMRIITERD